LLIQLPILIGLYWALSNGLKSERFDLLYPFVKNPGAIKTVAFGFLDLAKANFVLAILAGAAQFWQTKMLPMKKPAVTTAGSKDESMTAMMNKQMLYMMPLMTVVIGATIPGGLTLYWLVTTLLTGWQQKITFGRPAPKT
jgi:YidC/Oxa1 family membrane protein insertase